MGGGPPAMKMLVLCFGLLACGNEAPAAPGETTGTRLIAMGDVHGDRDAAQDALRLAEVVDADGHWIGGDTRVVQLGDQLDRGNQERSLLAWFDQLSEEASAAGGLFLPLIGNHEAMNVAMDLRYVTAEGFAEYADLADSLSPELRSQVRAELQGRVAAFLPGGPEAVRLSNHPVIAVEGGMVFVHGGVLPSHVEQGIATINQQASSWMNGERPDAPALEGPDSPLWTRAYSQDPDAQDCQDVRAVLEALDVARMVVAHTVQKDGINSACDGLVWRVDVGLSRHYGGPIQVIEFRAGVPNVLSGTRSQKVWK